MLRLENITKEYNGVKVLKNVSLSFRKREFVAILGPSGCGKTTLLNIIAALEVPNEGKVFLGNHDLSKFSAKKLDTYRSNYISNIFQNYNLINHINVSDNISLNLKLRNISFSKGQIRESLNSLNLYGVEKYYPNKLSGGEKQRVAIARSLISDSPIILADEPTGALDSSSSKEVMEKLSDIAKERLVIMVTHNEELAKQYANRIIYLKDGEVESDTRAYQKEYEIEYEKTKNRLKYLTAFKLAFNNLKNKKLRTYLIILAFSIGLISLSLVLAISNGFGSVIKEYEEDYLYSYPLVINKETVNLEDTFNFSNEEYIEGVINIKTNNIIRNDIDEKLLRLIDELDSDLITGIAFYKNVPTSFKNISIVNPNNDYFDLIAGKYPEAIEEVLLLLDQDSAIDEWTANYLGISKLSFEEVINTEINADNFTLKIVGIVQSNMQYFSNQSGILYNSDVFDEEIVDIHFYASSYEVKETIINYFEDYYVLDEARIVINLTSTLINGISIVLIVFSAVSLIVSVIMMIIITYISVLERQKEIGLLKSLGTRKKDIRKLFLTENMIIGVSSAIMSLEAANAISKIGNKYINERFNITNMININFKIIIFTLLISILLSYLAGLIPAKIASKKRIVDILYHE